jgi:tetratricopeptide (TPR) repeat protein
VPPLAEGFGARAETAADLGAALVAGALVVLVPVRVVGDGPGGWLESCGKTQLAACVAEALLRLRRVELLAWIVATSRASVLSGYLEAAAAVLGTDLDGDGESIAGRFAGWLGQTSRPWLVVLDDLCHVADLDGLWPAGPAGRVIITTSQPAEFSGEQGTLIHPVGVYSPDEAMTYLTDRLRDEPGKRHGAAELIAELDYEPLALAQASAVITTSELSCRGYLDSFGRARDRPAVAGRCKLPAASVTWTMSADHASGLSPGGSATALLQLAALLDGHGFPAAICGTQAAADYLAAASEDPASEDPADRDAADRDAANGDAAGSSAASGDAAAGALLAAQRAGLVSTDGPGAAGLVRMTAAVQAAVLAGMPAGTLERAVNAAAEALLQAWPADEQPAWLGSALRSCTVCLWRAAGDLLWAGRCHPVLLRAGQSLARARLTGPALRHWSELAEVSDRRLGRGHPDTLAIGERLAGAYLDAGQAAEAISWSQWVLTERVRVLGPDHPRAIAARRDVGRVMVAAGQFDAAAAALNRVIGDYERVRGTDHPDTLGARDDLAAASQSAGQVAEAIRLYRQTLASRERVQGPEHRATTGTRRRLAGAYLADGRLKDALAQYKRVLADSERVLGQDHPETIAARASLGAAYHRAGRTASALLLYEQSRAGYQRALGANHPSTLASSATLADAYYDAGRVTDATTLLRDTLERCEQVLPPGDPTTRTVRQNLADVTGE